MVTMTDNRVTKYIAKFENTIKDRLESGAITQETIDELDRTLDIDVMELCAYQERKSMAQAMGTITFDEAQAIYTILGESPEHFNRQPLSHKSCVTRLIAELLRK